MGGMDGTGAGQVDVDAHIAALADRLSGRDSFDPGSGRSLLTAMLAEHPDEPAYAAAAAMLMMSRLGEPVPDGRALEAMALLWRFDRTARRYAELWARNVDLSLSCGSVARLAAVNDLRGTYSALRYLAAQGASRTHK